MLALRDRGFRVSAAGTGDHAPFAKVGLEYHHLHFGRFFSPLADWGAFRAMAKLIANLRPSIVQCFDTKPYVLAPLSARGIPDVRIVSTINGIGLLYCLHSPLALSLRPIYEALQRAASRSTTATVFQNHEDLTFFTKRRMLGAGRNLIIPGSGIDIEKFEQLAAAGPSPTELRNSLGLGDCDVVMTVTRMTRQKGIPTLLEAAALVHKRRPDVRFLLVGPRESEGRFAVTQAELDDHKPYVMAIGRRSDVPALLGIADVFAFPSEYPEGVPRVLLEAAAAARPIVTTRMPGCSDVVKDGWNGVLVPPHAPGMLAEKILEMLRNLDAAAVMGARAAEFVKKEFNLEITVSRYAALYQELVKS
ncbi:glycosyltransferase [Microvirga massiliensis]|uniref:glycosyltransferase n=1 Tax=Microvirga massiliensis TaxID=1033741 RepID=UPI001FCD2021|nr:glycosyltransferase [Microvirga massiliensis]